VDSVNMGDLSKLKSQPIKKTQSTIVHDVPLQSSSTIMYVGLLPQSGSCSSEYPLLAE